MRKKLAILLAGAMAICALGGCGGSTQKAENSSTKTSQDTTETKKISVAVWDVETSPQFNLIAEAFKKEHPDIEVELISSTADEYENKVTVMLSSGDSEPDVIFVKSAATERTYYEKGQILKLDDYMERDGIDLSVYNGVAEQLQIEGETYALPFRLDWYLLFYNKDLFDAAGVEYPSNDMTWDEYEVLAEEMTSGEGTDKVFGSFHQTWLNLVSNWAVQDGTHTTADGEYSFMKESYERNLRMQENGIVQDYTTLKTTNIRYTSAFEEQQCAMCPMGSWFVATLIQDKADGAFDFNWGIATIPHPDNKEAGNTVASTTPVAINANTDSPDEAWEFVKFVTGQKCAELLAENGIFTAVQNDEIREKLAATEGMPEGSEEALLVTDVVFDSPIVSGMAEIGKVLEEEHDLIMIGEQDIDKGITNMNARVTELKEE